MVNCCGKRSTMLANSGQVVGPSPSGTDFGQVASEDVTAA